MEAIQYRPIGIIHSPWSKRDDVPIQPVAAHGNKGTIELLPDFEEGLADLEGFSHIVLLYHFHLSEGFSLKTVPRHDHHLRGVFATRSPRRPNPIGLSIVKLERVERTTLYISDLDIMDGTPLLDIKPYVPSIFRQRGVRLGWLAEIDKESEY